MADRSSSRRESIIQAALGCFAQHGVEATTIDMIRAASGASTGSLYHHFGNKERIAAEVYLEGLRRFRVLQGEYLARADNLRDGIRAIVHAHVDWICANPDWASFLFNHRVVLAEAAAEPEMRADLQAGMRQVADWIRARSASGDDLTWPLEAYAALIAGPVHDYARHWLAGRRAVSLRELRDFFADAAWRAVAIE